MKRKFLWAIGIAAIGVFLIAGIPIAINEVYKMGAGYVTLWEAKDVLNYYGAILGSFVTIAGLVITIRFTILQIQRDSYSKKENDKWEKTEKVVSDILSEINPMPILAQIIDTGFTNPDRAIFSFQKYQISCRTATDQLTSYINTVDYLKVKELIDRIADVADKFFQVSQKEVDQYEKQLALHNRENALNLLLQEERYPGSLSAYEIEKHQLMVQNTSDIRSEDIKNAVQKLGEEFIRIYDEDFRGLLQLKGTTFETINLQTQKNADAILSLRRK